jgi:hypothetical protein
MSDNVLQVAVKAVAPRIAAAFVAYIEANKATVEARITAAGDTAAGYLEAAIFAALPQTGVAAKLFAPEVKSIVKQLATEAIASAGGEVPALISLAELELTDLGAKLAAGA